jgi:hypothetical protein
MIKTRKCHRSSTMSCSTSRNSTPKRRRLKKRRKKSDSPELSRIQTEPPAFWRSRRALDAPNARTVCLLAGYVRKARCAIQPRQNQHIRTGLLVDPAAKYLDGTPPRLGNSVLTLIKNILINIVNQSITLSKETDFVFDFLSENIKTTGCADRSAGANCIS